MGYKKAGEVLPFELLEKIQEYVDGEYLYIPRKEDHKKKWGSNTSIRKEMSIRNQLIYQDKLNGMNVDELVEKYYLSSKSISRIVLSKKRGL